MPNKLNLYPFCDKWFEKGGTVWVFSDPHFNDPDLELFRKNSPSTDEIIKMINSKCGRNDTLICLGDVYDLSIVPRLRAGYKVLIMGNHDEGKTNFQRVITKKKYIGYDKCPNCGTTVTYPGHGFVYLDEHSDTAWCRNCIASVHPVKQYEGIDSDNRLFDEVYDGVLTIRKDIILSHERFHSKYHLNMYGHDHNASELRNTMFKKYDYDLASKDYIKAQLDSIKSYNLNGMLCCIEWLGYQLINLGDVIKSGVLKDIPDIHRETIDRATENPIKKTTKL